MRDPDDFRDKARTGKRAKEGAARTYLRAHLGWLQGFPTSVPDKDGIGWRTLPRPGGPERAAMLTVDRERLRQTEYARNAARRRFPVALARVVGDVPDWSARIDARLVILKHAVHDGAPMPGLRDLAAARDQRAPGMRRLLALVQQRAAFAPIATALTWLTWDDADQLARMLEAPEASELVVLLDRLPEPDGTVTALRLLQLAAGGVDRSLLRFLSEPRIWEVPCENGQLVEQIDTVLEAAHTSGAIDDVFLRDGAERPPARLGPDLAKFVGGLVEEDAGQRDRQMRAMSALLAADLPGRWQAWWRQAERVEREARRHLGRYRAHSPDERGLRWAGEGASALDALRPSPPAWHWPTVRDALASASRASPAAFEELMHCVRMLVAREDGYRLALRLLESWTGPLTTQPRGWGVIARLLGAQRQLLQAIQQASVPQLTWVVEDLTAELIWSWIDEGKPQRLIQPAMAALEMLIAPPAAWEEERRPFADYTAWDVLLAAVEETGSAEGGARAFDAVRPSRAGVFGTLWRAVFRLADRQPERFAAMAGALRAQDWSDDLANELTRLAKDATLAAIVGGGLEAGEGRRVARLLALSRLATALDVAVALPLPESAAGEAFSTYPAELRPMLAELARWDDDAVRAAERMLGNDFPSAARMTRELETLRRMVETASMDRRRSISVRIANLETRIAAPAAVSPRRLAKHRAKLVRRIAQARLMRWERALTGALQDGLAARMGTTPPAAWLSRPEVMQVLGGLAGLDQRFKALAFRLLGLSLASGPADLRAEPQNQAFIARLAARGINPAPWVDGIGARAVRIDNRELTLDIERDPLQIMRMGSAFETCLSPGAFNFFSTVANAADVNKRVLYARDGAGTIQVRCLMALTDDGHILTFHVYAHVNSDQAVAAVRGYVESLAAAMGTSVAARGEISRLVAPSWYDDGPRDLTGQLAFLDEGSDFMRTLKTLPADKLVGRLQQALGSAPITPSIVCTLARQTTISQRPELILPLLPHLGALDRLDPWSRLVLAPLLRRAGRSTLAVDLVMPMTVAILRRPRDMEWIVIETAQELIALGLPHRALSLIRQSRPAGVKDWSGEWGQRTYVAAAALRALRRPQQALELARIARERGVDEATQLIAELEQELGHGRGETEGSDAARRGS